MTVKIQITAPTIQIWGKTGCVEMKTWNIAKPLVRYLKNRRVYNFDPSKVRP